MRGKIYFILVFVSVIGMSHPLKAQVNDRDIEGCEDSEDWRHLLDFNQELRNGLLKPEEAARSFFQEYFLKSELKTSDLNVLGLKTKIMSERYPDVFAAYLEQLLEMDIPPEIKLDDDKFDKFMAHRLGVVRLSNNVHYAKVDQAIEKFWNHYKPVKGGEFHPYQMEEIYQLALHIVRTGFGAYIAKPMIEGKFMGPPNLSEKNRQFVRGYFYNDFIKEKILEEYGLSNSSLRDRESVAYLLQYLHNSNPRFRAAAVRGLKGTPHTMPLSELRSLFESERDPLVQNALIHTLAYDLESWPNIMKKLNDSHYGFEESVTEAYKDNLEYDGAYKMMPYLYPLLESSFSSQGINRTRLSFAAFQHLSSLRSAGVREEEIKPLIKKINLLLKEHKLDTSQGSPDGYLLDIERIVENWENY